ncbi:hypothetical protein CALVIDRAFT_371624 [Calocera viscosa TUFC12733]|uniref:Uncharacterized protein n=1 Tax=Calocera viscosa (strain TUFC12733) TaxID=1330018 RepID=A0A167GWI9_CALVF|nr:hypothetical protein CALVIDRAFT_371624 [Calocera viscosa TUFC12733]
MILHPPPPTAPYFQHITHHLTTHIARLTASRPHRISPTLTSLDAERRTAEVGVTFEDTGERWGARVWFTPREWAWLTGARRGLPCALLPSLGNISSSTLSIPSSRSQQEEEEHARLRAQKAAEEEHFTHSRLSLLGCSTGYPQVWGAVLRPPEGLPAVLFLSSLEGGPVRERWARGRREEGAGLLRQLGRAQAEALRGSLKAARWYDLHAPGEKGAYSASAWFGRRLERRIAHV